MTSKYEPLKDYLHCREKSERTLTLSFDDVERILGQSLPFTARVDRPWWANTRSSYHAIRWLDVGWKVDKVDLLGTNVTFTRINGDRVLKTTQVRYENLCRFFQQVPPQQEQIAFTFNELAAVIGGKLPDTALSDRSWWANTSSSPQGPSWMKAGWKVENVFLIAGIVTFRRKGGNPVKNIPQYIEKILNNPSDIIHPAPRTLVEWIRFCKRMGWYFQGVILYEKGGLNMDSLSESECAEVDEDYAVCKRELNRYREVIK